MRRAIIMTGLALALPLALFAAETSTPAASGITVDIKLGTGLNGHDVTGEADSFDVATPQIIGWTLVKGANQPTEIVHEWLKDGIVVSSATLTIKSSYFRTYSRKALKGQAGPWTFRVKDASGAVLGSKKFEVTARTDAPAK